MARTISASISAAFRESSRFGDFDSRFGGLQKNDRPGSRITHAKCAVRLRIRLPQTDFGLRAGRVIGRRRRRSATVGVRYRAHREWFGAGGADKMENELAGGQGDAETRPERRARGQDRRRGAAKRPVAVGEKSPGLAPGDKSRGGLGGQRPTSTGLRRARECQAWFVIVCFWSARQGRCGSRSIVCGFDRSRSFRTEPSQTRWSVRSRTRLHPDIHPFVDSTAEGSTAARCSQSPARTISRSTGLAW